MKKLIIFALILAISLSLFAPAALAAGDAKLYPDVETSRWSYPYISSLTEKGILTGNDDGTFAPARLMTNAEFVAMLVRSALGEQADISNPRHWAEKYIVTAINAKFVLDSELPAEIWNEPITRQSMSRMIMRALKQTFNEPDVADTATLTNKVKDWAEVCNECKPFVAQAYAKGIILGVDGSFLPYKNATREEAATIIVRMLDKGYRYTFYDGVPFCAKTDVTEDGLMKLSAAERFIMKTIDTLRFYKEGDRYFFTVTLPETPEGFDMWFKVYMDPGIAYQTNAFVQEQMIPSTGTITKELPFKYMPDVFKNGTIQALIGVTATPEQALVTHKDGHANLLAIYNGGKLEKFSTALVVTNGAASAKSATDMQLDYTDYFTY